MNIENNENDANGRQATLDKHEEENSGEIQAGVSGASVAASKKKKNPPAKILSVPLVDVLAPKKRTYARKTPANTEPKSKKKRKTPIDDGYGNVLPTLAVCTHFIPILWHKKYILLFLFISAGNTWRNLTIPPYTEYGRR